MLKTVSKSSLFVLSYFIFISRIHYKNGKKDECQAHIRPNPCLGAARSCRRKQIEKRFENFGYELTPLTRTIWRI